MTLRNRFLLVAFGIIVFLLVTPIITLYALGFKFDLQSRHITKTGSLIVKSEPDDAQIYIDDTLQRSKTSSTIRFLLPGDYNVKVQKPGYQSWTKRLNIRSGLVTWANQDRDYISLFLEQPKIRTKQTASLSAISVGAQSAVMAQGQSLHLINHNRGTLENLEQIPPSNPPVTLANSEMAFSYLRYPVARAFDPLMLASANQLEANSNYAALLSGKQLMRARGQEISTISENSSGFSLENEHLWYVEGNILKHANLNLGVIENIKALPYTPSTSKIIRGDSRIFLILDGNLYAVNDTVEEVYRGVTSAYWDNSSQRLVFANDNEALLFDPGSFKTELIIRSSTKISQPTVNTATGYLFFLNEGKVKAIELDGRDHRNVYTIADGPVKSFLVSDNGKLLTLLTDSDLTVLEIQ